MQYYLTSGAMKDLRRLEVPNQKRIIEKLDIYSRADNPLLFAKRLHDAKFGEYRFRIGEYRVIFDVRSDVGMVILAIGHRREIYR